MAISFINANSAAATSLTMPSSRQIGDLEVMWVFRSGSTSAPTIPSGWLPIKTGTTTSTWGGAYFRTCTNASDTSGTFTNASGLACAVYRGVKGIGVSPAVSGAVSSTIAYPTTGTFIQSGGNSWSVGCAGHRTASAASVNVAPTGMTIRTAANTGFAAISDTNGGVTSWSTASVGVSASSGHVQLTFELLADNSTLNPYDSGTNLTLSNSNLTVTINASGTDRMVRGSLPRFGSFSAIFGFTGGGSVVNAEVGVADSAKDLAHGIDNADGAGCGNFDPGSGTITFWGTNGFDTNMSREIINTSNKGYVAVISDGTGNGGMWIYDPNTGYWNDDAAASPDAQVGGFGNIGTSTKGTTWSITLPWYPCFGGANTSDALIFDPLASGKPSNASTFTPWDGANVSIPNEQLVIMQAVRRASFW